MLKYFLLALLLLSMPAAGQTPAQLQRAGIEPTPASAKTDEIPMTEDGLIDVEKLSIEQVKEMADTYAMDGDIFLNENFNRMSEEQQQVAIETFASKHVMISVGDLKILHPTQNVTYCQLKITIVNGMDKYVNSIETSLTYGETTLPFGISKMEPQSKNSAQTAMVGEDCMKVLNQVPEFEVEDCSIEGLSTEECRMAVIFM